MLLLAAVAALAVPAAAPLTAQASFGSVLGDTAAKPKKKAKKKCKKSQVRVKVGKRVSCRPLKKAFPRPKKGDPRKLVTNVAVQDWSKFRSRRGKRLPSLPKLIRKVGPGASKLLATATARGFTRLDAMASAATAARLRGGPRAQAAAGCDDLARAPRQSSNFTTGGGGGPSATVGVNMGPDGASLGIELTGNDYTVKADLDMGLCDPNEVEAPPCPTAVGKLEGQIRYKLKAIIEVSRNGVDVWSQGVEVTRRTKLVGWNEVDAKLDRLDVEDVETSNFSLGGTTREHPPISIRTRIERRTQVDMRSGSYDPGRSNVDITMRMEGFYGPDRDDAESAAERKAQADADQQFRAVIEKAIAGYRNRESEWQRPTCADLKLNPEKNRLTLSANASGSFTATAIAKSDGNPSELDARLSETENAVFSPTRAGGQSARFEYSGVNGAAPAGSKVRVKVRATSKAGVAEDKWEQPIKPPFEINEIAGNFSGSYSQPVGPRTGVISWTASGTFVRQTPPGIPGAVGSYVLKAGIASIHFSGGSVIGDALCDMSGSTTVDLFQAAGGSVGVRPVNAMKPFEQGPHLYGGTVGLGFGPTVDITESNCVNPSPDHDPNHPDYPIGALTVLNTGPTELTSPDGIEYSGSYSDSQSGITNEWTWVLTGRKTPP